jgi:DNA-3-methyladenine glycosylase I
MHNRRCHWCNLNNPLYISYHDTEWCFPHKDDKYLYEIFILETFQSGLSWECILNKREFFRKAYDGFDIDKVCLYGDEEVQRLFNNPNIIRNKQKIIASIENSKTFKKISEEFGSFHNYIISFTGNETIYETNETKNQLSDRISNDLKKRGMKFVGSTTIYSYLQAIGIIYSHEEGCILHINNNPPTSTLNP